MTSFYLNCLFKGPASNTVQFEILGVRALTGECGEDSTCSEQQCGHHGKLVQVWQAGLGSRPDLRRSSDAAHLRDQTAQVPWDICMGAGGCSPLFCMEEQGDGADWVSFGRRRDVVDECNGK